ncbi:MAG: hypothetical protein Fur0011_4990 [Candidatus Microgenomates bacterium]
MKSGGHCDNILVIENQPNPIKEKLVLYAMLGLIAITSLGLGIPAFASIWERISSN